MLTPEIIVFLLILLTCIIMGTVKANDLYVNAFTFVTLLSFSFTVRLSGFDADMGNYEQYLSYNSFSIYYLKEPIYWLGSRVLYDLTDSAEFVFIFYDIIFFILIIVVRTKLQLPKYFPFLLVLFFPTVLGMQNVFRQFIASGFLLLLFSQVIASQKLSLRCMTFLFAGLSHNVSFLFLPLMFLNVKNRKVPPLFLASSLAILALLPIAAGSKSNSVTGDVPAYIYVLIFSLMIMGYALIFKCKFKVRPPIYTQFLYLFLFCYVLLIEGMLLLGSAQSKRLGMFALFLCIIPLTMSVEIRFKQKILIRILFIVILTAPTLLFKNALSLLQTTEESLKIEATARSLSHHGDH